MNVEESQDESDISDQEDNDNNKSKKEYILLRRNEDEKDFEDEVEYEKNVKVRERFNKYRHLQSFRTSPWNKYQDVPDFYQKLSYFKNF